ncbi:MAG: hypothetical protein ACYDAQ_04415 [Mycobacteriales bacterium]
MHIPVDTTRLMLIVTGPSEAVTDFETKRAKLDERGVPLFATQLAAVGDGGGEVYSVKTPGAPPVLPRGAEVRAVGLVATPWSMGERTGVSFRAERIEPVAPAAKTASAG